MNPQRVVIVGGGAAGFFAAIACAEHSPRSTVTLLEKSSRFLAKVLVSGGGRCNLTHACFDPRELARHYPRGARALRAAFMSFQPRDTVAWFESRGVRLKTEADGRMFPATDSAQTVVDCLLGAAEAARVQLHANCAPESMVRRPDGTFALTLAGGEVITCDRLLLATGGCRVPAAGHLAVSLGHTLEPPVPSLFTFHLDAPWLVPLAGISVPSAEVSVPGQSLRERGPVLITHAGLSGPAILRLSAWGARLLHQLDYRFPLRVHWLPQLDADALTREFDARRTRQAARRIVNTPLPPLAGRLWDSLVQAAGIPPRNPLGRSLPGRPA